MIVQIRKLLIQLQKFFKVEVDKKKIQDQQTQQLKEQNEIAQDLIKMGLANNPNDKLDQMIANT